MSRAGTQGPGKAGLSTAAKSAGSREHHARRAKVLKSEGNILTGNQVNAVSGSTPKVSRVSIGSGKSTGKQGLADNGKGSNYGSESKTDRGVTEGFSLSDQGLTARQTLEAAMQDPDADLSQRINAAKALAALDLRGAAAQSSAVSRMTRDELCAEIARIKGMIPAK
jgi:hypothetical protein